MDLDDTLLDYSGGADECWLHACEALAGPAGIEPAGLVAAISGLADSDVRQASLLPGWSHPIGYVLAPTWGVMAVRAAALGGNALGPIAACIVLSFVYLLLAAVLLQYVERLARRDASLSLA